MDRRTFCQGLVTLGLGTLLAACEAAEPVPPTIPVDLGQRLAGVTQGALVGRLVVAGWAEDTPVRLSPSVTLRERDPSGVVAVTSYFNPGYHRVTYAVFSSAEDARRAYTGAAEMLRANPRGRAQANNDATSPTMTLFYDDVGTGALLVGPVLVRLIVGGSNRDYFAALARASIAHLQRVLTS
ncbi:MAG TPA: hypothetical protein VIL85_04270 [Thermomicrobiales bacterium]|jgi:hypothetical protein